MTYVNDRDGYGRNCGTFFALSETRYAKTPTNRLARRARAKATWAELGEQGDLIDRGLFAAECLAPSP